MESGAVAYRLDLDNPWPGLAWFDESSAEFFKGRDREVAELKRLVDGGQLTVLFGRSGLGKTSLLKAGLFPALRRADFLPVYLRFDFTTPRAPGTAPIVEQLFAAFQKECTSAGAEAPARDANESLWEYLHRTDFKLWSAQNVPVVPVFVIDQFEEVFTLGPANPQAVGRLREDLADLAENRIPLTTEQNLADDETAGARLALRSQRYRILLSFREDFATRYERWYELPSLMRNRFQLLPMTGAQAFDAVYGPATQLMDQDTARLIVRFVASEKRADRGPEAEPTDVEELTVEPALLSLVCRGLNNRRHERRASGGLNRIDADLLAQTGTGLVDQHYEACMADQPERVHWFVENELITESGFRNPCAQDDARREPYGLSLEALTVLVDRRLLRFEPSLGVTRVELIHDLLTPTVVARRDARRRADQKRELEEAMREQENARRAADAERRSRALALVAGIALVVALGVGVLANYARQQANLANREREAAKVQAQTARSRELASAAITRLELDPQLAVRLAMHAADVSPTIQAESALRQALYQWRRPPAAANTAVVAAVPMRELKGHTEDVMGVAFSPDGTRLLSVSCDGTARLWHLATDEVLVLRDHRSPLAVGAFSRDGRAILTAGGGPCITSANLGDSPGDTEVRVWDVATGQVTKRLPGSPSLIVGAAFNSDGSEVAAGNVSGQLLWWPLAATKTMRELGRLPAGIQWVEFSPDGRQIATAGLDGNVLIWDPATGKQLAVLGHENPDDPNAAAPPVLALAYGGTEDGGVSLASVDMNGVAKVWNAKDFELRREIRSYGALNTTAFSRDGRFLVTAGEDLSIWETATGAKLPVLTKRGGLYAASITTDGQRIAVGGADGFLGIFECGVCVPMDGLVKLAAARPPRQLTAQERKDFLGGEP